MAGVVEHSTADRCTKSQGTCPFCGHTATFHDGELYLCPNCNKSWRDLHHEPTERERNWWAFLRREWMRRMFDTEEL